MAVAVKTPKRSKSSVAYENPAKNPAKHCSICTHYQRGGSCELVAGQIAPGAWCRLYRAK